MRSTKRTLAAAAVAASGALIALAAPASAGTARPVQLRVTGTVTKSVIGPLQFAVSGSNVYVADSFTSTLTRVGVSKPIATGPSAAKGGDLAGVAVDPQTKAIAYTTSNGDHSDTRLTILGPGAKPVVADLSGFEKQANPDKVNRYGTNSTNACVVDALKKAQVPVTYRGDVDSHPYAVTAIGKGAWAVADAGGNDVVKVDRYGHVSLISVLPAQPVKVTAAFAKASGLPSCVAGITYAFEPVPTDVEVGREGDLYVTTLPGGPEGPDNGNPGSVYRIGYTGKTTRVATGFAGATNLAIDKSGGIYVAQISTGKLAKVICGKPVTVLSLPGLVGVEYANGHLYASTAPAAAGGKGPGSVVELSPGV